MNPKRPLPGSDELAERRFNARLARWTTWLWLVILLSTLILLGLEVVT